jgi:hypothetical protein
VLVIHPRYVVSCRIAQHNTKMGWLTCALQWSRLRSKTTPCGLFLFSLIPLVPSSLSIRQGRSSDPPTTHSLAQQLRLHEITAKDPFSRDSPLISSAWNDINSTYETLYGQGR